MLYMLHNVQARLNLQQMLVCICGVFTDNSNGVGYCNGSLNLLENMVFSIIFFSSFVVKLNI